MIAKSPFDDTLLFRKNIQGDIVEVYDDSANLMLSYTYDAWGNVTATVHDESNQGLIRAYMAITYVPITYRGYMYDAYTGLYYLQSRYYNSTYGRFLNADTTEILESTQGTPLGSNLFAYCNNNPIFKVDPTGRTSEDVLGTDNDNMTANLIPLLLLFGALILIVYLVTTLFKMITTMVIGVIEDAIATVKQVVCVDIPYTLREQMERAKTKADERVRCEKTNKHHIVAKNDYRAEKSRILLFNNKIDINDPANLATINREVHWFLHTTLYHTSVFEYLESAAGKSSDKKEERLNIILALWTLNAELMIL